MLNLPLELQNIILSFLDSTDLWLLLQVSRSFRQLSISPLLLRCNISPSQINLGSISLPEEAYFLIPMIYHIHPIQKLSIVPGRNNQALWGIPSVLSQIPQIPDVTICGVTHAKVNSNVVRLLTDSSRGGKDPLVIVGLGSLFVSRPRYAAPMKQLTINITLAASLWSPRAVLYAIIACVPFIIICIVTAVVNAYRILTWLFRAAVGPPWDQSARIAADLGWMHGSSMRIQIISVTGAGQFTLATFSGLPFSRFTIAPLPALSTAQTTALLGAIDLNDELSFLTVKANCALDFFALLALIDRHQSLYKLALEPNAIHPASLGMAHDPPFARAGRINSLTSPAMYIPHILRTEQHVESLTITSAADGSHLPSALGALASSDAGARVRNLSLNFTRMPQTLPWRDLSFATRTRKTLPWRAGANVEAPLRGVMHLTLVGQFRYRAGDAREIARWLVRFPALVSVDFRCGQSVPVAQQAALVQAIMAARVDTGTGQWEGVYFNV